MTKCRICKNNGVIELLNLGEQPVCNKFLGSKEHQNKKFPLIMGLCKNCGLVQLIDLFPQEELKSEYEWITYIEPEGHLDNVANIITKLPNMGKDANILGVSFKDDSLLERMKKLGFENTKRLDLQKDLGSNNGGGIETIQQLLDKERAKIIIEEYGKFDLILVRHILEHAYNIDEFISALKELVKGDGYIMFEVPDYTKPFEHLDYSTIWEEHIVYFTPETYKIFFSFYGLEIKKFELYAYLLENSLVAVVKNNKSTKPKLPDKNALKKEGNRALDFFQKYAETKERIKSFFSEFRKNNGKIAVFGAGHNACLLINVFGLKDYIECIIDDDENKQGFLMPGSKLPIIESSGLLEKDIKLSVFGLNPQVEDKIIAKNEEFIKKGGKFLSFCPMSKYSIYAHKNA